jgi:hypothetical protein
MQWAVASAAFLASAVDFVEALMLPSNHHHFVVT